MANVSEGRDTAAVDALGAACRAVLLDVHSDPDHHRSVFTLAGSLPDVESGAGALAAAAVATLDLRIHAGVHPRLGVLDVVPFVALDPARGAEAVEAAGRFARRVAAELGVPTFLYGDADPAGRSLPEVRRDAFSARFPDFGPGAPHATAGAAAVGARPLLVAVNCDLDVDDLGLARAIAAEVRERDGGLPGVRALGLRLDRADLVQVSMNLTNLSATGIEDACTVVRDTARAAAADVARVELVGLMPASELERCGAAFLEWARLDRSSTIEGRLEAEGRY